MKINNVHALEGPCQVCKRQFQALGGPSKAREGPFESKVGGKRRFYFGEGAHSTGGPSMANFTPVTRFWLRLWSPSWTSALAQAQCHSQNRVQGEEGCSYSSSRARKVQIRSRIQCLQEGVYASRGQATYKNQGNRWIWFCLWLHALLQLWQ